jgi:hypothetical protein
VGLSPSIQQWPRGILISLWGIDRVRMVSPCRAIMRLTIFASGSYGFLHTSRSILRGATLQKAKRYCTTTTSPRRYVRCCAAQTLRRTRSLASFPSGFSVGCTYCECLFPTYLQCLCKLKLQTRIDGPQTLAGAATWSRKSQAIGMTPSAVRAKDICRKCKRDGVGGG